MQIGVDSFGAVISDPATGLTVSARQRMDNLLDEIVLADQVGRCGWFHAVRAPLTESLTAHRSAIIAA
jgi:hypothetical protein